MYFGEGEVGVYCDDLFCGCDDRFVVVDHLICFVVEEVRVDIGGAESVIFFLDEVFVYF